ncbi:hypothetical protein AB1L05_14730 [Cytobacillus horneckiae]|uniref:hypothetical protein n=1 Tax=Cytobacillus horneckiae TaxID=549687 RepID=UPI001561D1D2|nr:hypothetical protein [Bacillus sp. CRN 9]
MFGTVQYFINSLKSTIMINHSAERACSLQEEFESIKHEIAALSIEKATINHYLNNAEKAYSIVRQDVIGWEEKEDEH